MVHRTASLSETHTLAKTFISDLVPSPSHATVLALHGNLGAGKTAFMQGVAQALGVEDSITSPTFVLEKIYLLAGQKFERLVHIDAYRLEGASELKELGWAELVKDPKNLIAVEWAELVEAGLPEDTKHLRFTFIDDATREIELP